MENDYAIDTYAVWDKSLSVGVEIIDNQHKKWLSIINKLHSSLVNGQSDKIMNEVLAELEEYTKYHFGTEEDYFKKFNYEYAEEHEKQHLLFMGNISSFKEQFNNKGLRVSINLLDFLKDWLINHISNVDKGYSNLFNENGLR